MYNTTETNVGVSAIFEIEEDSIIREDFRINDASRRRDQESNMQMLVTQKNQKLGDLTN